MREELAKNCNDQRRVIFAQRMKILKSENVEKVLEDFLNEVLNSLASTKNLYQKSNDEKNYLTTFKTSTGNVFSDKELISIASLDAREFVKKIKELYLSKRKSRIDLVGAGENNSLEKCVNKVVRKSIEKCNTSLAIIPFFF